MFFKGRAVPVVMLICVILAGIGVHWGRGQVVRNAQLEGCSSNLKNLGVALEQWLTRHPEGYPERLSELTPYCIYKIPKCPACGKDTYSASYVRSSDPPQYVIWCNGGKHGSVTIPAYSNVQGPSTSLRELKHSLSAMGVTREISFPTETASRADAR